MHQSLVVMAVIDLPLLDRHTKRIAKICEEHRVKSLYVFGSLARNELSPDSDIDFLVDFKPMEVIDYGENYFQLCESLENLLDRKVDLMTVNSLKNPYLKHSIKRDQKLVFESND